MDCFAPPVQQWLKIFKNSCICNNYFVFLCSRKNRREVRNEKNSGTTLRRNDEKRVIPNAGILNGCKQKG